VSTGGCAGEGGKNLPPFLETSFESRSTVGRIWSPSKRERRGTKPLNRSAIWSEEGRGAPGQVGAQKKKKTKEKKKHKEPCGSPS